MAGTGEAWGLREKNTGRLFLDRASADVFCTPGRCWALIVISRVAAANARVRNRPASVGSRAVRLLCPGFSQLAARLR